MTELADARAYLLTAQAILEHVRLVFPRGSVWITDAERQVLAALSWVWDAQCRAIEGDFEGFLQDAILSKLKGA